MGALRIQVGGTGAAMGRRFVVAWHRAEAGDLMRAAARFIAEDGQTFRAARPAAPACDPGPRGQTPSTLTRSASPRRD